MKITFFDLEAREIPIIQSFFSNTDIVLDLREGLLTTELVNDISDTNILSISFSKVSHEVIEKLPKLQLISTRTAGFDNIDLETAKEKKIPVINVPVYADETVAEYALGLILTLSRKLSMTFVRSLYGIFEQEKLRGFDLNGKTLGVIGTGKIGRRLIKLVQGFEMNVICYDPFPNEELIQTFNVTYHPLDEILKSADIISLHVPYRPETHHLLNQQNMQLMKNDALLVNTARGPIIETSAILNLLKENKLGGVALDTFEGELAWLKYNEITKNKALYDADVYYQALEAFHLLRYPNVVLTPHNAFNTIEAVTKIINITLEDINTFINSGDCQHKIN